MDVSEIPFYYWIGGIVLLAAVYLFFLNEDSKAGIRKFVKKYLIFIIGIIAYIYFYNSAGFFQEGDFWGRKVNTYAAFGLAIYGLTIFMLGKLRYETPSKFVGDGCDGSFAEAPDETENGFVIVSLGGIRAGGLHVHKGNKIAVFRKETSQYVGPCLLSIAHFKKVNRERLPFEVKYRLEQYSHLKGIEEIYYGWFDSEREEDYTKSQLQDLEKSNNELYGMLKEQLRVKNPTFGDLVNVLENWSAIYNKLQEQFEDVTTTTEKYGGHISRMQNTFNRNRNKPPAQTSEESV